MFSKACEYGIRAIVYIASESDESTKVGIKDICSHIEAPQHFTAKILQTLTRRDIVSSQKGVHGGFYLSTQQKELSLYNIVEAIDGDKIFTGCGLGLKHCSAEKPCPIHDQFGEIRNQLKHMMETTTIEILVSRFKNGNAVLIR